MARPVHAVDEEQILIVVAVEVEKGDAAAHRLGKVFLAEGPGVVLEADTGGFRDVVKLNPSG